MKNPMCPVHVCVQMVRKNDVRKASHHRPRAHAQIARYYFECPVPLCYRVRPGKTFYRGSNLAGPGAWLEN